MADVRKGYCHGCPFDYGMPATEMAYNLGCLPSIGEVAALCVPNATAWACHSEPDKVCCGHAARRNMPLQHMEGVHALPVPPQVREGKETYSDWIYGGDSLRDPSERKRK